METRTLRRPYALRVVAVAFAAAFTLVFAPAAVGQSLQTYRIGIDPGNQPGTGCAFSLGGVAPGSLPGFELQVTVVVGVPADGSDPEVVSAQVEQCVAGVFANPQPLEGFSISFDDGAVHSGSTVPSDSIRGAIPLSMVGDAEEVRLAFHALSADGAEDALVTRDGGNGPPIVAWLGEAGIPLLSPFGIAALAATLAVLGLFTMGRRRWAGAVVIALALTGGGAALAAAVYEYQVASDPDDDATAADTRAEIVAAFSYSPESALGLRLDLSNVDVHSQFMLIWDDAGQYVTVDPVTGKASATAANPFTWGEHFRLVEKSGAYALQSVASGRYLSVHTATPPDPSLVFDDAADLQSATGWAIFVVATPAPGDPAASASMSAGARELSAQSLAALQSNSVVSVILVEDGTIGTDIFGLRGACDAPSADCDLVVVNYGSDFSALVQQQFSLIMGPR